MGEVGCLKDGCFQNLQVEGTTTIAGTLLTKKKVVALTTTKTVAASESGTVFTLSSAGGAYDVTLPDVGDGSGCHWRFINAENTPTADITIKSNAANIVGVIQLYVAADAAENSALIVTGHTNILFDTTALIGDYIEIVGNGTNYFVKGAGSVNGAFTMS
jgi:hypothetical protein